MDAIYINEFDLGGYKYKKALGNYIKRRYENMKIFDELVDGDIVEMDIDMPISFTKSLEVATNFALGDINIELPENIDEILTDGIVLKINSNDHEVYNIEPISLVQPEKEVLIRKMKGIYVVEDVSIMEIMPYEGYDGNEDRLFFKLIQLKRYT